MPRSFRLTPVQFRAAIAAVAIVALLGAIFAFLPSRNSLQRVAIGGGAYHGMRNTQSIEALEAGWQAGYRRFMISLRWTSDGFLVCVPNWQQGAAAIFKDYPVPAKRPMTLQEFNTHPTKEDIRPCTLETLIGWLNTHPAAKIMVDMPPARPMEAANAIKNAYPDFAERIIPHAYNDKEYKALMAMGYARGVLVLLSPPRKPYLSKFRDHLRGFNPYAVTIPLDRALAPEKDDPLVKRLREAKVGIYARPVDDCNTLKQLKQRGIGEAYTHILTPQDCPL